MGLASGQIDSYLACMKICVACGGTGGHIFPGLASADALRRRGHEVTLWLGGREVEAVSVDGWEGPLITLQAVRLNLAPRNMLNLLRLLPIVMRAVRHMRRIRPDVLLAMGSYTSVAPVLAARLCRVPVVLHEANAVPGKAVSVLARFAETVGLAFPWGEKYLASYPTTPIGFPLRREIYAIQPDPSDELRLLVMGGSQGARALNELIPQALTTLHKTGRRFRVTHLAGAGNGDAVQAVYRGAGVQADVRDFAGNMAEIYANTDFAIARSGAATCFELAACRIPALLIPHPFSIRDHQTRNAESMAAAGGMDVCLQDRLSPEWLADYLQQTIFGGDRLAEMRQALAAQEAVNATARLADLVEKVASARR